jgi:hypothetical protein
LDSVEYKNQLSPVVLDAERMIYDAKAQEIDGILNCTVSLEECAQFAPAVAGSQKPGPHPGGYSCGY